MYDNNSNGFGSLGFSGLGGTVNNMSQNPLLLAVLQMMGNNSPRIGQLPNTMEGVPQIMMAASQQQRTAREKAQAIARAQAEKDAEIAATVEGLVYSGMPRDEAMRMGRSKLGVEIAQGYRKQQRSDALRQEFLNRPDADALEHGGEDEEEAPAPPQQPAPLQPQQQPQQQQPLQPQQPQRQMRQTQTAPDPEALQQALSATSSQFDAFGRANVNKTVGEISKELARSDRTKAAVFVDAAKRSGLSVDSKLTGELLSNPVYAAPLAKSIGIGADLPDEHWTRAHAAAFATSKQRQAAQRTQQLGPGAQGPLQEQAQPPNFSLVPSFEPPDAPAPRGPNLGAAAAGPGVAPRAPEAAPQQQAAPAEQPERATGPATRKALIAQDERRLKELKKEVRKQEIYTGYAETKEAAKINMQGLREEIKETRRRIDDAKQADAEGIPVGHDPKRTREKRGESFVAEEGKAKGGVRVLDILDKLEEKTKNPLFAKSVGPMREYAHEAHPLNPARLAYEYSALGPNKEEQAFLGQIKSDAQAINSELQRAYLAGQGQVTEAEREQINRILGSIAGARSAEEARGQIENVREIVKSSTQRKNTTTPQQGYGPAAPSAGGGARRPLSSFQQ